MLTAWAKKLISCTGGFIPQPSYGQTTPAFISATLANGTACFVNPSVGGSIGLITKAFTLTGDTTTTGIAIGSGNAPESENSYFLDNQLTGFTGSISTETVVDTTNYQYKLREIITVTNNTGNDFTIKEVGLFKYGYSSDTRGGIPVNNTSARRCIMLDRTLLPEPVIVPNGESRVIHYEFTYPT